MCSRKQGIANKITSLYKVTNSTGVLWRLKILAGRLPLIIPYGGILYIYERFFFYRACPNLSDVRKRGWTYLLPFVLSSRQSNGVFSWSLPFENGQPSDLGLPTDIFFCHTGTLTIYPDLMKRNVDIAYTFVPRLPAWGISPSPNCLKPLRLDPTPEDLPRWLSLPIFRASITETASRLVHNHRIYFLVGRWPRQPRTSKPVNS